MSEPARCHGCNSERVDVLLMGQPAGKPLWTTSCRICGLAITRHTREESVEAWNQRPTPRIEKLIEKLAEYAHSAWSGWMRYQFKTGYTVTRSQSSDDPDRLVAWQMGAISYERWQRQMNTPYDELPEKEKQSDRDEASKILSLLAPYLRSKLETSTDMLIPMADQLRNHLRNLVKHDKDYTVRYGLVISAFYKAWALGYKVGIRFDESEPEWPVVFVELPTGQCSWHLPRHANAWDGHTSEEKLARIRKFLGEKDEMDGGRQAGAAAHGQDT